MYFWHAAQSPSHQKGRIAAMQVCKLVVHLNRTSRQSCCKYRMQSVSSVGTSMCRCSFGLPQPLSPHVLFSILLSMLAIRLTMRWQRPTRLSACKGEGFTTASRSASHGQCVLCRPKACLKEICRLRDHPLYWRARLCWKHGRNAVREFRRPYQTLGGLLTKSVRKDEEPATPEVLH